MYNYANNNFLTLSDITKNQKINIYVCGPTVYNFLHIGNFRPFLHFDLFLNILELLDYDVTYIVNVTDIDDKIIAASKEQNFSEKVVSDKYLKYFIKYWRIFDLKEPTYCPSVTENIQDIIDFIALLIQKGFAYKKNNNVWFDTKSFPNYLNHSNRTFEESLNVREINQQSLKKVDHDFALWKSVKAGMAWDSPFGQGRPGWHTECVALINKYTKQKGVAVHGGGVDLIFPHHENEIAQFESLFPHKLSQLWMYVGQVNYENRKMSKSLNNVIYLHKFCDKYDPLVLRLAFLDTNYRRPLNATSELFQHHVNVLNKILFLKKLIVRRSNFEIKKWISQKLSNIYQEVQNFDEVKKFMENLLNDFNTPNCLSSLFKIVRILNKEFRNNEINILHIKVFFFMLKILNL